MTKRMLIDATHAEETRVAVVDGTRLVDFDYESQVRKQLKGGIFLAKVTRVEPSLQAAFVNFGGNRHGFLPFSEIHPDYFRIPIADREALLAEQQRELEALQAEEEAEEAAEAAGEKSGGHSHEADEDDEDEDDDVVELGGESAVASLEDDIEDEKEAAVQTRGEDDEADVGSAIEADVDAALQARTVDEDGNPVEGDVSEQGASGEEGTDANGEQQGRRGGRNGRHNNRRGRGRGGRDRNSRMNADSRRVEIVGGDGIDGDHPVRPSMRRNYKIQEVVKRGQIMLIQVSKEERGNKGAAVTTYLSLPGRYCVLMPNSARGGGVSRKIANFTERRRMREILTELQVPDGMSVIMRTAGMSRNKAEIKRDLDYLTRLWDNIRELTLQSTAPALIHEEGSLIRRSIRDIYTRDIEEVHVAGDEGYKVARDFMKMMIPSHVKRVLEYKDEQIPLFHRYQVESQISSMGETTVNLKSGGYLVINPTEALVSVDVNSGRATKERHIEETALKTNLEAAEEVARQLRLRDLGGLVVIDFIDMEDRRNNRRVEEKLKQALSNDRARIQIGRISSFGLLELSRQRLNPSLTEAQFEKCKHCSGVGHVRTVDSASITALRALEDEGIRNRSSQVILKVSNEVALYILNNKRALLADIERRYGFVVLIRADETLAPVGYAVESVRGAPALQQDRPQARPLPRYYPDADDAEGEDEALSEEESEGQGDNAGNERRRDFENGDENRDGRRRRRGRRGGRRRGGRPEDGESHDGQQDDALQTHVAGDDADDADDSRFNRVEEASDVDGNTRPGQQGEGRRRRRGGRNRNRNRDQGEGHRPNHDEAPASDVDGHAAPESYVAQPTVTTVRTEPVSTEILPPLSAVPASNDVAPLVARSYETVNEEPAEKKKGWWNRLKE